MIEITLLTFRVYLCDIVFIPVLYKQAKRSKQ